MGDAAGEDHRVRFGKFRRGGTPLRVHLARADQQQPRIGMVASQIGDCGDQIVDAFIGIEAADIAD